jgi:hypothetical protein
MAWLQKGNIVAIYLLETTALAKHRPDGIGATFKKVVLAKSAPDARQQAANDCQGLEKYDFPDNWLKPRNSTCTKLDQAYRGGVICVER